MVERYTYTPTNTPHVCGNCDPGLKDLSGRVSVQDLKTSSNIPDEALTESSDSAQDLRVPVVYVLNLRGQPLMPTTPGKARRLLKERKAKVKIRTPFTIQLLYPTGEAKQRAALGVDSGYKVVGLSVISGNRELYCAEVELRTDMVNLISERRAYRRVRRSRKTRYRPRRLLNRARPKDWLAPSIQHKLDSHVRLVGKVKEILPVTSVLVEVAAFDVQKIKNQKLNGIEHSEGPQKNFRNVREYCLHRDGHACRSCGMSAKDGIILKIHHLESRRTGGSSPDNLITLCSACHNEYHAGNLTLTSAAPRKTFRAEAFMTMVWLKLTNLLSGVRCYGHETKFKRLLLGLAKTHANDAFVIAGGSTHSRSRQYLVKQVRKQNRKLFKGQHSAIRNTAPRFILGFQRYDKVLYRGQEGFVAGRRRTGYFSIKQLNGKTLNSNAKVKECRRLESANTWLISHQRSGVSQAA